MSNFKNCTKCSGFVLVDRDEYGWYEQCLMCGFIRDLESIVVASKNNQGIHYPKKKMNRSHQVKAGLRFPGPLS